MRSFTLRSILSLLVLGAALAMTAPAARAQENVLRARDLRSSAPLLYDAIAQLRPGWLHVGADSTGIAQIAVYVNGRYLGDGRVLRTLETARVTSARLRSAEFIRASDLRLPRERFAYAIEVDTRPLEREALPSRTTLSVDGGLDIWSLAHGMRVALQGAGYHRQETNGNTGFENASALTPSVSASLHFASDTWGLALTAQHTFQSVGGGFSPPAQEAASAAVTTTEAAALATRDFRAARVGVGPVYRRTNRDWARDFCRCFDQLSDDANELGVAAEARIALPYGSRVFPGVRVMARWYPPRETDYYVLDEQVDVGGLVVTTSLSLGTRF